MIQNFLTTGFIFILTLAFGVWLSRTGKPYNNVLFNIHKLAALGVVILTSIQVRNLLNEMDIQALHVLLFVVAGLSVVALFLTGALMSIRKPDAGFLILVHQIAPVTLVLAIAALVYQLGVR